MTAKNYKPSQKLKAKAYVKYKVAIYRKKSLYVQKITKKSPL